MESIARVTAPTVDVLGVLLEVGEPVWGLRIAKQTGRAVGTVYPILSRLESLGWLIAEWENAPERGGPRRRLYRLTEEGAARASATVVAHRSREGSRRRSAPAEGRLA